MKLRFCITTVVAVIVIVLSQTLPVVQGQEQDFDSDGRSDYAEVQSGEEQGDYGGTRSKRGVYDFVKYPVIRDIILLTPFGAIFNME
jgi:hypothetical protein